VYKYGYLAFVHMVGGWFSEITQGQENTHGLIGLVAGENWPWTVWKYFTSLLSAKGICLRVGKHKIILKSALMHKCTGLLL